MHTHRLAVSVCEVGLQLWTHTQDMPARRFGPDQRKKCDQLHGVEKACVSHSPGHFYPACGIKYAFKARIKDGIE